MRVATMVFFGAGDMDTLYMNVILYSDTYVNISCLYIISRELLEN